MNRRDLLKIGATIAAMPAAIPAVAEAQTSMPQAPAWNPAFFNSHQLDTITNFSDIVIPATDTPGAKDAQVPRYLDKILAASDHPFQNEFARDLDALDRFSRQTAGGDFVRLTPDRQKSVLEKMFESDQRSSFDRLKAWTARVYYATKPGFDELNKGGHVPGSFACKAG
jgi:gluconate 2-dehydrogenase gamma chain